MFLTLENFYHVLERLEMFSKITTKHTIMQCYN